MPSSRDVTLQNRARIATREPRHEKIACVIVRRDGLLSPVNRPNLSFVRELGRPESQRVVWNDTTLREENTPVWVEIDPNRSDGGKVVGINDGVLLPTEAQIVSRGNVGIHGDNHQYPGEAAASIGPDPVLVYQPAFQPLKTTGNGMTLIVSTEPLIYNVEGTRKVFDGITTDLTSSVPSTASRSVRVLLYLDVTTNLVEVSAGTEVIDSVAIPVPYPKVPQGSIPSGYVKLTNGQTAVTTATHVDDARAFYSSFGSYSLPFTPTAEGQILIVENGKFAVGVPVTDAYGDIVTDSNGEIVTT